MKPALSKNIQVAHITQPEQREAAVKVLKETYAEEKNWIGSAEAFFPLADLSREDISWFITQVDDVPVCVLRVLYNPPLELYKEYGFEKLDNGLDVESFVKDHKIAEIGRFAVIPAYRSMMLVVAALMRAASRDTIERGYSHYVTDIFEGEKHSPYDFHTRVMGFEPVATHDVGELNCPNRRITMILDIHKAYHRLKSSQKWVFRFLTKNWPQSLHDQCAAQ